MKAAANKVLLPCYSMGTLGLVSSWRSKLAKLRRNSARVSPFEIGRGGVQGAERSPVRFPHHTFVPNDAGQIDVKLHRGGLDSKYKAIEIM